MGKIFKAMALYCLLFIAVLTAFRAFAGEAAAPAATGLSIIELFISNWGAAGLLALYLIWDKKQRDDRYAEESDKRAERQKDTDAKFARMDENLIAITSRYAELSTKVCHTMEAIGDAIERQSAELHKLVLLLTAGVTLDKDMAERLIEQIRSAGDTRVNENITTGAGR